MHSTRKMTRRKSLGLKEIGILLEDVIYNKAPYVAKEPWWHNLLVATTSM